MLFLINNMKRLLLFILFLFVFIPGSYSRAISSDNTKKDSSLKDESKFWFLEKLNIPKEKLSKVTPIKIAIIDDGFRLTHKAISNFIFKNSKEIPHNFRDDDNNGYADDITGWDFADKDNDVSVPNSREDDFYHGTYIAGIITKIFQEYFGEDAVKYLQIIPIKVVSDNSKNMLITNGYEGIKYADEIGADIICCAWSGGQLKEDEKTILKKVIKSGKIIIGSSGNFFTEQVLPPSSFEGAISVAAVDSDNQKEAHSNYGMRVDISAPGQEIFSAHPKADNAYIYENGTSPAAAIITGCVVILKAVYNKASTQEILDALKNTSVPLDYTNRTYAGKLGSGIPDISNAIKYLTDKNFKFQLHYPKIPEGTISFKPKLSRNIFEISPYGDFLGVQLIPRNFKNGTVIKVSTKDSIYFQGDIGKMNSGLYLNGNYAKLEVLNPKKAKDFTFDYYMQTIDSTILYCKDIKYINQEEGEIEDGSGNANYANNCSCKWLITVPNKKRMRIEFSQMDTQANIDFVWIFEGNTTIPEFLLAKFSGQNMPPVITTTTNQTLIWFVTDKDTTGKGWKMKFKAVD